MNANLTFPQPLVCLQVHSSRNHDEHFLGHLRQDFPRELFQNHIPVQDLTDERNSIRAMRFCEA